MDKTVLNVEGMSCEHCVKAITSTLNELNGVGGAFADLETKTVTVEYDSARISLDKIKLEIEDLGYDVV